MEPDDFKPYECLQCGQVIADDELDTCPSCGEALNYPPLDPPEDFARGT
jgi:rubrerythrin